LCRCRHNSNGAPTPAWGKLLRRRDNLNSNFGKYPKIRGVQILNGDKKTLTEKRNEVFGFRYESRSGLFELVQACALALVLADLGLVDPDGVWPRDVATGKRVQTKIRELGRLKWDWKNIEVQNWLKENWSELVDWPLGLLKAWVRESNPDAKTAI